MVALPKQQANMWQDEPVQVQRGDIFTLGAHRLMCGSSSNGAEVEMLLQDAQPDLIFADPPYGIGIDDWDKAIADVPLFLEIVTRHLKQGGFFAFTHQMPYMLDWLNALEQSALKYKDHIAWVKRTYSAIARQLIRCHENLFIYSYGKAQYHQTKGRYEDVKLPGILVDTTTLEGIDRYIKDLQLKIKRGTDSSKRGNNERNSVYGYMVDSSERSPELSNFTNVWSFLPEHQSQKGENNTGHATAKPILLMERLITLCAPEQATVYDAFLGSGTTLIAAEKTWRVCYGMELSEAYCSEIIGRWQTLTCQRAVREVH